MKAQEAGAKGFKIYGVTCVGQDYEMRCARDKNSAFGGYVGNNFTSEYVLGTGAIDLVFSEFNCTLPGIEPICQEYLVKQICLDDAGKKVGADLYQFKPEKADEYAAIVLEEAIKAYKNRREKVKIDIPAEKTPALTGFCEDSIKAALGGSWRPLIDLIVKGDIKGVAGVVGCSNMAAKGHGVYGVELTKELIKRDILVLGCRCCEEACADANGSLPYWEILESGMTLSPNISILYVLLEDKNYPLMAQAVCRQCEDAPCVKICPVNAINVNEEGIKVINKQRCIGCHSCSIICPFGAVYIPEKHAAATKCTLCVERKGAEGQPACVEACPNDALKLVDTKEIGQEKVKKNVRDSFPGVAF